MVYSCHILGIFHVFYLRNIINISKTSFRIIAKDASQNSLIYINGCNLVISTLNFSEDIYPQKKIDSKIKIANVNVKVCQIK